MNKISYKVLNALNNSLKEIEDLDSKTIDKLCQIYINNKTKYNLDININNEDVKKLIITMYDILKFYISEEEFEFLLDHYLSLIAADALENKVDLYWCITHMWYLYVGRSQTYNHKYKTCLSFLEQRLIDQFEIKETISNKIKRKTKTSLIVNNL